MLIDLSQAVGSYLQNVFVMKLNWWVLVGYAGQALFTMRFVVQWIASERAGRAIWTGAAADPGPAAAAVSGLASA